MKVKNIMFSGFAAAILMGAVEANAAFEIASKAYVDGVVGENGTMTQSLTTLQNKIGNAEMGTTAETVTGAIGELDGKVDTLTGNAQTTGSVAHAEASAAAAQGDVDALEAIVGSGFDTTNTVAAALDTKVDKTATSATLPAVANASASKYANELAVATAIADLNGGIGNVSQQISDALGGAYGGNNDTVADVLATKADKSTIAGTNEMLANDISATTIVGAINELNSEKQDKSDSTVAAADVSAENHLTAGAGVAGNLVALGNALAGAESDIDDLESAVADLETAMGNDSVADQISDALGDLGTHAGANPGDDPVANTVEEALALKADADDVYTKNEMDTLLGAKLAHPATNTCTATSGHCVLSLDTNNNLTWVDITNPAE